MRIVLTILSFCYLSLAYAEVAASGVSTQASAPLTQEVDELAKWLSERSVIKMYQYSVDRNNCDQPLKEPWHVREELSEKGVEVIHSERGVDGLVRPITDWGCRNELPTINIITVTVEHYEVLKEMDFLLCEELREQGGYCHSLAYSEMKPENRNKYFVHVYKYSNKKQCVDSSGMDIHEMEKKELVNSKVVVYQRYEAIDGLDHSIACGGETGDINVYVIEKSSLAESLSKGFRECAWLVQQGGSCHPLSK